MLKVKQLIRILEKEGWVEFKSRGSHRFFHHADKKGIIQVPFHGNRDLPGWLVIKILKQVGLWEK